jgi:hypothetical protein
VAGEQDACLETGMNGYPLAALERTMKIQEAILRALAKKITWWQTGQIIGMSARCGDGPGATRSLGTPAWRRAKARLSAGYRRC